MTPVIPAARAARLHRLILAAVVAPTIALGSNALLQPAIASAAPREWDIETYDNCMSVMASQHQKEWAAGNLAQINADDEQCCAESEGNWNAELQKCEAPPANQPGFPSPTPNPLPPGAVPPGNPPVNNPGTNPGGKKPVNTPIGAQAPNNPNRTTGTRPSGGLQ